jgi:hypothetical protein
MAQQTMPAFPVINDLDEGGVKPWWKGAGEPDVEGQLQSFRITSIDPAARRIELRPTESIPAARQQISVGDDNQEDWQSYRLRRA